MQEYFKNMIRVIDPKNADFIMNDRDIAESFERAVRYFRDGKKTLALYVLRDAKRKAADFSNRKLTPANIRVGDGVTVNLWSDRYAATVIAVTKRSVTVRRDKATLDPGFKPEWVAGGFVGHCINQSEQTYTYEPDVNGDEYSFCWSRRHQRYEQTNGPTLSKGRHEFYDYNF